MCCRAAAAVVPALFAVLAVTATGRPAEGLQGGLAERLTGALIDLGTRERAATPDERPRLVAEMRRVADQRRRVLVALIETRPDEVLHVALPAALAERLPPDVRPLIERRIELEGIVSVLAEDPGGYRYSLEASGTTLSLHFAADPPALLTGSRVRVRGVVIDGKVAIGSGSADVDTLAPP